MSFNSNSHYRPNTAFMNTGFRGHDSLDSSTSPIYVFFDRKLVTKGLDSPTLVLDEIKDTEHCEPIYVGELSGQAYYVLELKALPENEEEGARFEEIALRVLLDVPGEHFQMAGRALQLLTWDKEHRFCGKCAAETLRSESEWKRECSRCSHSCYPRLAPCVIMAIRKGRRILLAQRPGAVRRFYTVLAGFVEPGESAEQAVRREVYEEVGLQIKNIRYFASQPWPFPGQLMIGFFADFDSGELNPDLAEVENAGWFDLEELPDYPGENTIAGRLIRQAVAEVLTGD